MKLSQTMLSTYKHRSASGIRDLQRFRRENSRSCSKVAEIRSQLDLVLGNISQFLSKHDEAQSQLIGSRHEHCQETTNIVASDHEIPIKDAEKKPSSKTVCFATPIECST